MSQRAPAVTSTRLRSVATVPPNVSTGMVKAISDDNGRIFSLLLFTVMTGDSFTMPFDRDTWRDQWLGGF
jgi:hypothetical protein